MVHDSVVDPLPEGSRASFSSLRGWRRFVARVLAFWYLSAVAAALVLGILLWIWLIRTSPLEQYWECMESAIAETKATGARPDIIFDVWDSAYCARPSELSEHAARVRFMRLWDAEPVDSASSP